MKNAEPPEPASPDETIDELMAAARCDDERIWDFQQALQTGFNAFGPDSFGLKGKDAVK